MRRGDIVQEGGEDAVFLSRRGALGFIQTHLTPRQYAEVRPRFRRGALQGYIVIIL